MVNKSFRLISNISLRAGFELALVWVQIKWLVIRPLSRTACAVFLSVCSWTSEVDYFVCKSLSRITKVMADDSFLFFGEEKPNVSFLIMSCYRSNESLAFRPLV